MRWRAGIPIIHGGDRVLYIGDHRVTLDLSADEVTWLAALERNDIGNCGTYPGTELRSQTLLDYLRAIGALASPTECWWLPPHVRRATQPQVLSLSEWHSDPQSAIAARTTWRIGVYGSGALARSIDHLVADSGLSSSNPAEADLIVVVGVRGIDAPEALLPAAETDPMPFRDRPHLPVSVYRAHASIGPLVVPGRTACLNCMHLHRRDTDPKWPHIVQQWRESQSATAVDADPLLAWQAASSAVAMIRNWIDSAQTAPPHRIRWHFPHPTPSNEVATAHPACGCLWPA